MVHIILTGATGLVGSAVLHHIFSLPASNPITKLSILSRSPVPSATSPPPNRRNTTTQIDVINHTDYLSYSPQLLAKLSDASAVIWAQGVSSTDVSAADYRRITYDYPLAAAKAFSGGAAAAAAGGNPSNATARDNNAPTSKPSALNFIYVSGEGATHHPGMFTQLFARVKGEAELALLALNEPPLLALPQQHTQQSAATASAASSGSNNGSSSGAKKLLSIYTPRPGGIYSTDPQEWQASLARRSVMMRTVMRVLLPVYKVVHPNMLIPAEELAGVLVKLALRGVVEEEEGAGEEVEGKKGWELKGAGVTVGDGVQGRVLQNVAIRELAGLKV